MRRAVFAILFLAACQGSVLVVGGSDGGDDSGPPIGQPDATTGSAPFPSMPPVQPASASLATTCGCSPPSNVDAALPNAGFTDVDASAATVWGGYLENFTFASGSDHVVLALVLDGGGQVGGKAFFGDPPAIPPPTNPDAPYPPGADAEAPLDLERFPFTILNGTRTIDRITFDLFPWEFWNEWCELQPTVYAQCDPNTGAFTGFGCLPTADTIKTNHTSCVWGDENCGWHSDDCAKIDLCVGPYSICSCSPTGCTSASNGRMGAIHFDMQVTADKIDGTIAASVLSSSPIPIHLTRNP